MMAGRRSTCDRLVPMPLPRLLRLIAAGAVLFFNVTPGWAQAPAPVDSSQSATQAPGDASRPPNRVRVSRVAFTGVSRSLLPDLRRAMTVRPSSRWPWGRKTAFSRAALADDLRRIETFYDANGYPEGRVDTFDVVMPAPDRVELTFHVIEGEAVRIASVDTFGLEVLSEASRRRLMREIALEPGQVRTRAAMDRAREVARTAFQEEGFPFARVAVLEAAAGESRNVALTIAAEPGRTAVFGPVTITGQHSVGEQVIRRQLAFGPGDPFRLSRVLESQRRLYNMELFDFVNLDVPPLRQQPEEVPIAVRVTEGSHHRLRMLVGYGSEERGRIGGTLTNVNFLGGGRTGSLEGKYSSLDRGIRARLATPYFFSPSYKAEVQIQQWDSNEPAYHLLTRGGRGSITRELVRHDSHGRRRSATRATMTFVDEYEEYEVSEAARNDPTFRDDLIALGMNPDTGADEGTLVALALDVTHDTAGNPLDARRGFLASLHLEQAVPTLGGAWQYFEVSFDGRAYVPVGRAVVATKVRVGGIEATGADVPFFKRYFLGGSTTLRGWGRFEVSPLREGYVIGGLGFIDMSAELRAPIRGALSGVVFLDAGQVTEDSWTRDLFDLQTNTGVGVRYATPIGPIRFDFGYQLKRIPGLLIDGEPEERRWRIHLSVGQAF
jgi:outer membrane protein insertion porin family/translocation and assembly module TamA